MKPDTDPDVFLSEINQIRDELSVLDKAVSIERLTTRVFDALLAEMYSIVKLQAILDHNLSLEQIQQMMRAIFIKSFGKGVSYEKEPRVRNVSRVKP